MFARTWGRDKREEKRGKKEECEAMKFDRTPLSDQVFYSTVNASAPMNPDLNESVCFARKHKPSRRKDALELGPNNMLR